MSYQTLYSMPCRLPCQRYLNFDSFFEGSANVKQQESFDGGQYEPSVSREAYEYEPTVAGEMYTESTEHEANCECGPRNRPYRMEQCGYNQSPTWDARRAFSGGVVPSSTMEGFEQEGQADCGCAPKHPPYRMEKCGYNQSPTWSDQAQFRAAQQNRPF